MKTLLITCCLAALCILNSCKKSSDNSPGTVQIEVSGLTTKTSVSIKVIDNTAGITVLNISNKFGNTTYNTSAVSPGDQLQIHVSANVNDNLAGDGDGTFKYSFKGHSLGAHGGQINIAGFDQNLSIPTE